METCTVETGLLKKKPCGQTSVTKCENCEQPLCSKHAIAQLKPNGLKSGKFMCKECDAARRDFEKNAPPPAAAPEKKPAEAPKGAAAPPAAAAAAQKAPAAPAKAAPAAKPAEVKHDDDAPLEFTPSKPKPPAETK